MGSHMKVPLVRVILACTERSKWRIITFVTTVNAIFHAHVHVHLL